MITKLLSSFYDLDDDSLRRCSHNNNNAPTLWVADPSSQLDPNIIHCSHCGKQSFKNTTSSCDDVVYFCKFGCGAPYCSKKCQTQSDEIGRHSRICVGPVDESHPLFRFKSLSLSSFHSDPDMYATLTIALELVCCYPRRLSSIDFCGVTITAMPDEEKKENYEKLVSDSYELISEIVLDNKKYTDDEKSSSTTIKSLREWKQLLSYVRRNTIKLSVPSIWADKCRDLTTKDGWTPDHEILQKINNSSSYMWEDGGYEFNDEDYSADGSDDAEAENYSTDGDDAEAEDEDYSTDGDELEAETTAVGVVELMDEPDAYFAPIEFSVMFLPPHDLTSSFEHSCVPTHEHRVVFPDNDEENGNNYFLDIQFYRTDGEDDNSSTNDNNGMTISFIDNEADLETRTELLSVHGIRPCECVRCGFERRQKQQQQEGDEKKEDYNEPALSSSSSPSLYYYSRSTLTKLLSLAKKQHRYEDALLVCNQLLVLDPKDPVALFDRSRIVGWIGDFGAREMLLEEAAGIVSPEDGGGAPIHAALREAREYYRDDWNRLPVRSSHAYSAIDGMKDQAFVCENLHDAEDCARMVKCIEEHQREHLGGWTTSRHYAVPTTDVPIYRIPPVLQWFNKELETKIFPVLRNQFMGGGSAAGEQQQRQRRLRIFDAFFVKYDARAGQKRLPLHNDQSVYSLTIAMNPSSCYEGGGTYFAKTGEAYKTDVGGMVSFRGELLHAGKNIESGTRYIIACFLYVEEEQQKKRDDEKEER